MKINRLFFLFVTITLCWLLVLNRVYSLSSVDDDYVGSNNGLYLLLLTSVIVVWGKGSVLSKHDKLLILLGLSALPAVFLNSGSMIGLISNILMVLSLVTGIIFGKILFVLTCETNKKDLSVLLIASPFLYCLIYLCSHFFYQTIEFGTIRDTSLLLICYLPFLLLLDSKVLKYILLVVSLCLILLFSKRTSIIYILLILLFSILGDVADSNKLKRKRFGGIIIIILIIGYILFTQFGIDNATYLSVFDRFNNILDDGGSGRDVQYAWIIGSLMNSNVTSLFFGYGPNAVAQMTGIPAHNDILELSFDYGIVAGFVYFVYLIILLIRSVRYIRQPQIPRYYCWQFCGIVLGYIVFVNMNCVFINPLYSILLLGVISYYEELLNSYRFNGTK